MPGCGQRPQAIHDRPPPKIALFMSANENRLHQAAGVVLVVLGLGSAALLSYGFVVGKNAYVLPLAAFMAVLLAAFWMRHPRRARVTLFLSAIVSCCYLAEVILAVLLPFRPARASWEHGRDYDFRTFHAVVRDLRQGGSDAFSALLPAPFLGDWRQDWTTSALGGISSVTTVLCNELGSYLIYQSDEHGFHNPAGLWGSGKVDIAAVGDSYTHGACVAPEQGFVSLIRESYPRTLNLGMGNNGPLTELATVKEYLAVLRPRVVLWFFYEGNDLIDLGKESSSSLLLKYLRSDYRQGLLDRQAEIDRQLRTFGEESLRLSEDFHPAWDAISHRFGSGVFSSILRMQHLRGRIIQIFDDPLGQTIPPQLAQMGLFREVLASAQQTVASWEGKLYFVLLPGWSLALSSETKQEVVYENVHRTVKALGIPMIDLVPVFRTHRDPLGLFVYPGSHYNPEGHEVVRDAVLTRLNNVAPGGEIQ